MPSLLSAQAESVVRDVTNGVVAERQRHFTVYEDQVGSTPIHFAKFAESVFLSDAGKLIR